MRSFLNVIDGISVWSGKLFAWLSVPTVAVISFEVVMRYVFRSPTQWANETAIFLSAAIYTLGGAYLLYLKRHPAVDVVYVRFPLRIKGIADLITSTVFFLYVGILVWLGSRFFWASMMTRETTPSAWAPPVYPVKLLIPLGAALVLLQGVAKFIRDLYIALKGREVKQS